MSHDTDMRKIMEALEEGTQKDIQTMKEDGTYAGAYKEANEGRISEEEIDETDVAPLEESAGYDGYRVSLSNIGGELGNYFSQTEEGAQKFAIEYARQMQPGDTITMNEDWSEHPGDDMEGDDAAGYTPVGDGTRQPTF